jgi:hypothetical protein
MTPNTGGPAFLGATYDGPFAGMTLRDYFAAKAMQARLTGYQGQWYDRIATESYEIADAMLKAREA